MRKNIKVPNQILVIYIIVCLYLTACTQTRNTAPTLQETAIPSIGGSSSYVTANSIKELVEVSSIIVIGKVTSVGNLINMARNVDDITKPDANILGVGQIYQFEVERYLKGDGEKVIYVVQYENTFRAHRSGCKS